MLWRMRRGKCSLYEDQFVKVVSNTDYSFSSQVSLFDLMRPVSSPRPTPGTPDPYTPPKLGEGEQTVPSAVGGALQ